MIVFFFGKIFFKLFEFIFNPPVYVPNDGKIQKFSPNTKHLNE